MGMRRPLQELSQRILRMANQRLAMGKQQVVEAAPQMPLEDLTQALLDCLRVITHQVVRHEGEPATFIPYDGITDGQYTA